MQRDCSPSTRPLYRHRTWDQFTSKPPPLTSTPLLQPHHYNPLGGFILKAAAISFWFLPSCIVSYSIRLLWFYWCDSIWLHGVFVLSGHPSSGVRLHRLTASARLQRGSRGTRETGTSIGNSSDAAINEAIGEYPSPCPDQIPSQGELIYHPGREHH